MLYRKIFVPEESLRSHQALTTRDDAYYPVEREEFQRLLSEARVKHIAPEVTLDARITEGSYLARLDEPLVMTGTAQLSISHLGPGPAMLPLRPMGLAISRPFWVTEGPSDGAEGDTGGEPNAGQRNAQVGVDESGRIAVLVDQSGVLQFDWSLRGRESVTGDVAFDVRLPAATVSFLELKLPKNHVPMAETAMVTQIGKGQAEAAYRDWRVQFGRESAAELTIGPPNQNRNATGLVMLRQTSTFQLAVDGTELVAVLRLDVYKQPLSHLSLELDNELHLISAQHGTTALTWSEMKASPRRRLTLEFPTPLQGANQEITLRAVTDGLLGKLWRLPRIYAPDVLWLAGETKLEVPDSLVVDEILTTDCRQTGVSPLSAPQRGESIQLQEFQPRASAEIIVNTREMVPSVRTGTTIQLGTAATNLTYVADILSNRSSTFLLEIDGSVVWHIDRVETQPPGLLDDWKAVRRGAQRQSIQVRLKDPLAAVPSMQLVVYAHQNGLRVDQPQTGAALRFGQLQHVDVTRQLILLAADAPNQLRLTGDTELSRLSTDDLAESDLDLIRIQPGGVVFVDDVAADSLAVSLSASPPNFRADIEIVADFRKEQVEREFTILCTPESSSVDRIQVQFTEALGEHPRWTWLDAPDLTLQTRQVDAAETDADITPRGETWSIVLPEPQDKPFSIRAQGTGVFRDDEAIPLVSVLGASPQSGSVTVRSTDALPIDIQPQDLWPIPAGTPPRDEFTSTRGVFRYEPSLEGRLHVIRAKTRQNSLARVWNSRLDSRLHQEGLSVHTARFFIENNGLSKMELAIPDGIDLLDVQMDDEPVQLSSENPFRTRLAIALPEGRRFPLLTITYSKQSGPLASISLATAPWLQADLPTFKREWILWLPPGMECKPNSPAGDQAWSRRLFGPVLRSEQTRRFHPLSIGDYRGLLDGSDSQDERDDSQAMQEQIAFEALRRYWGVGEVQDLAEASGAGWSPRRVAWEERNSAGEPFPPATSVRVVRSDFMRAIAWAAFLSAAGLAGWITHRRAWLGLPLCIAVGIIAMLGPVVISPVLASCFLGSVTAFALTILRPRKPTEEAGDPNADGSGVGVIVMQTVSSAIVVVVILWLSASAVAAQESVAPQSETPSDTVYRVLYPIDEEQEPLGPYIYAPRDFLSALQRGKSSDGASARQWMIHDAVYRVVFEWDVAEERLVVREVVADWRLTTFRTNTRVRLPVTQDQGYLLPDRAKLDGERASVAWEPDGAGLAVSIPRMGPTQLTLAFRPRVSNANGLSSFGMGIPPLPNALARLQLPRDASGVRCPTALGSSTLDNQIGERVVRLGPTDRLVAQWSDDPYFDAGPSGIETDQLTWLRVRPGSVVLHGKFAISCLAGEIREAELVVDPRLRMLPPKSDEGIAEYRVHEDASRTIHIEFQPPYGQEIAFEADFVVSGVSGVGVVRVPHLALSSDRTNRRWLGISIDPSLQVDAMPDPGETRIAPSNFAAAWDSQEQPPQLAMSVADIPSDIVLATRPREPVLKTSQHLSVSCGLDRALLRYEADIEVVDGSCFQYRLAAPATVNVHSISIAEEGDEFTTSWTRRNDNEIIVRGKKPMAGAHRLILQADLPIPKKGPVKLPKIRLTPSAGGAYNVRLYRQSRVNLNDVITSGYAPIQDSVLHGHVEGLGRLEAAVTVDDNGSELPPIQFSLSPNRPRTRGTLLIFLRRAAETWQLETLYELQVQSGLVDALRFEIPAAWTGPLKTDFAARQEMIDIPDQERRYLVLRPDKPIASTTQFRISGELSSRPGEQVRAPDVVPLDVRDADRYLIAPETIGQKQVIWVTDGLRAMPLPPRFADQQRPNEETYLANQPRFQATIEEMKQDSGVAGVALADFHLDCRYDGSIRGVATFDVLPAGRTSCLLQIPQSCSLLLASVDDMPARLKPQGPRQWELQLGSPQLPQQVQVIFQGVLSQKLASGHSVGLPAPALVDLPVQKSLWTVQSPRDDSIALAPVDSRIDAWSQEVVRLDRNTSLVESASDMLAEIDPTVARRWYLPWMRRISASRDTLHRWAHQQRNLGAQQAEELAALDARCDAVLEALTEADLISRADLQSTGACRPADIWTAALVHEPSGLLRLDMDGQHSVQIGRLQQADTRPARWAIASLMIICAAGLAWLSSRPAFDLWRSWIVGPALILIGMAWWNWCAISPLGLAIALVGGCQWLRFLFFRFRDRFPTFRLGTKSQI